MWNFGNLNHDRRGAGSIIGVVFIVLILLIGFTFYSLNIDLTEDYTDTVQDMQELDFRRNKEDVEFARVLKTSENKLNITLKNIGSFHIYLIWLGVFNETATPDSQNYYELDIHVDPAEKVTNIGSNITIYTGQLRIQLVTQLGNIFSCSYLPEEDGYDFVDEEGSPPAIGSHSLFSAQQAGPDGIVDTLIEVSLNDTMDYRKNLTINHNYVDGNLTNFPVLINIYDNDLHDDVQSDGDDIDFTDIDGNNLDHEIEFFDQTYNSSHAHLVAWVQVNLTGTSDTVVCMLYGNSGCGSQQNPTGVWDSDFLGVWHLPKFPDILVLYQHLSSPKLPS